MKYIKDSSIQYICGEFYCSEIELQNFFNYLALVGGTWDIAIRTSRGSYFVPESEESYILEFINLFGESSES